MPSHSPYIRAMAAVNLFCAACSNDSVSPAPVNTKAIDFCCPQCDACYQLKASRIWNERRIPDAGYSAMISAIRGDRVPNLVVMQYSDAWKVQNLLLVPSFLFNESAIEKRKPLAATARRAGWVGCNIRLSAMPEHGKIRIVDFGIIARCERVRQNISALSHYPMLRRLRVVGRSTF